ncbi:fermentation-respiration switch protein FrsA (DUF1100 family) [Hasllibacter halocynthiae]|uniref:Fermentation-respiration switch protein FrsA (DUF1100 family) n=1 Tax=Hasllibacter halocynthiae TaxID=595589 RepID=A0A2T0XA09_9RHOB|nr:fermentation-respiration switch protein FrsA (DUF1100 family) [Hasllibacter halocynthiae]
MTEDDIEVAGDRVHVWRVGPRDGTRPAVVMAHGFSGVIAEPLLRYADRFAKAGLVAVLFDYRTFGRSGGRPRQWMDIPRQQEDWRAVIDWARGQPGIDASRIALWGTSFSGGHVMDLAAGGADVQAVVAQAPFADGRQNTGDPRQALRLFGAALRDRWRGMRGRYPYYIGAAGHPGDLAAMTTPDAVPHDWWQQSRGTGWENRITPRVFLQALRWRPGAKTAAIACPLLVQVAAADAVTPPQPARDAAAAAPRGRAVDYDIEHFEIYFGEPFERAVADEIAFLQEALVMEDTDAVT